MTNHFMTGDGNSFRRFADSYEVCLSFSPSRLSSIAFNFNEYDSISVSAVHVIQQAGTDINAGWIVPLLIDFSSIVYAKTVGDPGLN